MQTFHLIFVLSTTTAQFSAPPHCLNFFWQLGGAQWGKEQVFLIYVGYRLNRVKTKVHAAQSTALTTDDPWHIFCQMRRMEGI